MHIGDRSSDAAGGINISQRGIFPAGHKNRQVLVRGGDHPAVSGIDLVKFLEPTFFQNLEKKFVRESALFFLPGGDPFVYDHSLNSADGFLFRNARVGDPI